MRPAGVGVGAPHVARRRRRRGSAHDPSRSRSLRVSRFVATAPADAAACPRRCDRPLSPRGAPGGLTGIEPGRPPKPPARRGGAHALIRESVARCRRPAATWAERRASGPSPLRSKSERGRGRQAPPAARSGQLPSQTMRAKPRLSVDRTGLGVKGEGRRRVEPQPPARPRGPRGRPRPPRSPGDRLRGPPSGDPSASGLGAGEIVGQAPRPQTLDQPPSMTWATPVVKALSSEAR